MTSVSTKATMRAISPDLRDLSALIFTKISVDKRLIKASGASSAALAGSASRPTQANSSTARQGLKNETFMV
jgi:hypothetical protein